MAYRGERIKKGLTVKEVLVSADTKLLQLLRLQNANYFYRFTVTDGNLNTVGIITETDLERLVGEKGSGVTAGQALKKPAKV